MAENGLASRLGPQGRLVVGSFQMLPSYVLFNFICLLLIWMLVLADRLIGVSQRAVRAGVGYSASAMIDQFR